MNRNSLFARSQYPFRCLVFLLIAASQLLLPWAAAAAASAEQPDEQPTRQEKPIPVLAYYYIWFDQRSWERAKSDYPTLGRYSSDNVDVLRQHILWAKAAGIDGFIVSWKSTPVLNARLAKLMRLANSLDFKLAIIYQGLDFHREPLPVERVASDLDYFISRFSQDKAFQIFEKPVLIWSGTWKFSYEEVAGVTQARRENLLILASERNATGLERLAEVVDGNAYYWSSVNPDTFPGYEEKLQQMGEMIHARRGIWIAPAAPGFDARLIGGTRVIERSGGDMLRRQMTAAIQSAPDAVGLISWNEFSENSHIEPSENYGELYLEVMADINQPVASGNLNFDSSEPGLVSLAHLSVHPLLALGGMLGLLLSSFAIILRRQRSNFRDAP
jgi:hypothetical protein